MRSATKPLISIGLLCIAFAISYVANAASPEVVSVPLETPQPVETTPDATSSTPTPTPEPEPEPQNRGDRILNQVVSRERVATVLSIRAQERIINLAANLSNRFDALVLRLDTIANRLESRITKIEATGVNLSEARAALTDARTQIARAKAQLTTIDTTVIDAVSSPTPRTSITNLRALYSDIATSLRQAHSDLRRVIAAIRAAGTTPAVPPVESGTTTDTANQPQE